MQAAAHLRQYTQVQAAVDCALLQGSLRAKTRSRDQADFVVVDVVLVVNIEQSIFLRSADDQSRDDVGGSHEARLAEKTVGCRTVGKLLMRPQM